MSTSQEKATVSAKITAKDLNGKTIIDQDIYNVMDSSDGVSRVALVQKTIAHGDSEDLDLTNITTGRILVVESDQPVRVTVNAGSEYIQGEILILSGATLTAVSIENQSGNDANIKAYVIGK